MKLFIKKLPVGFGSYINQVRIVLQPLKSIIPAFDCYRQIFMRLFLILHPALSYDPNKMIFDRLTSNKFWIISFNNSSISEFFP